MKISCGILAGASLLALGCVSAMAQQVTGVFARCQSVALLLGL